MPTHETMEASAWNVVARAGNENRTMVPSSVLISIPREATPKAIHLRVPGTLVGEGCLAGIVGPVVTSGQSR